MSKPQTQNAGAAMERTAIRAYIMRQVDFHQDSDMTEYGAYNAFNDILKYLKGRQARYDKMAGGLGRKRKTK